MQDLAKDAATDIADLLTRFSFDLNGFTVDRLVNAWLSQYPANWVRFSLVEALYQGRYKAVSVEQILRFWQRRGRPIYHFNHEFERIIRGRFSQSLLPLPKPARSKTAIFRPSAPPSELTASPAEVPESVEPESVEPADGIPEASLEPEASPVDWAEWMPSDSAIQSFSDRLKLLSSEESIAFLKLRSFENLPHPISRDLPIQAFKPIAELESESFAQSKWVKLAVAHGSVEEIHQFVPSAAAPPEFYSKLKAAAAETSDEMPNALQSDLPEFELSTPEPSPSD